MSWVVDLARKRPAKEGEANLYGVIIYSNRHAHVSKMLQDDDYWKALDEISGPRWAVYATRMKSGEYERKRDINPFVMHAFVPVYWKEPSANKELLSLFQLESTEKPVLVVFTESVDGELFSTTAELNDSSVLAAYESIKGSLQAIASVLEVMLDENRRVEARAFELAKERLWQERQLKLAKDLFKWLKILKDTFK
jgi:hypothetical protein